MPGKVIASSARGTSQPKTVPLSAGRPAKPRGPLLPPRQGLRFNKNLFYGAVALVAVVALVVVIQQTWHSDSPEGEIPTLKMSEALPGPPAPPPASEEPAWFTIIAATYAGSPNGERLASHAQSELHQMFFPDVMVVGYPEPGNTEAFQRYEVLVGRARTADDLADALDRLRAIDDWKGGKAAPFVSAKVVPHPVPGEE